MSTTSFFKSIENKHDLYRGKKNYLKVNTYESTQRK